MYSKKTIDNFSKNELSNPNFIFGGSTDDEDIEKDKAGVPEQGH